MHRKLLKIGRKSIRIWYKSRVKQWSQWAEKYSDSEFQKVSRKNWFIFAVIECEELSPKKAIVPGNRCVWSEPPTQRTEAKLNYESEAEITSLELWVQTEVGSGTGEETVMALILLHISRFLMATISVVSGFHRNFSATFLVHHWYESVLWTFFKHHWVDDGRTGGSFGVCLQLLWCLVTGRAFRSPADRNSRWDILMLFIVFNRLAEWSSWFVELNRLKCQAKLWSWVVRLNGRPELLGWIFGLNERAKLSVWITKLNRWMVGLNDGGLLNKVALNRMIKDCSQRFDDILEMIQEAFFREFFKIVFKWMSCKSLALEFSWSFFFEIPSFFSIKSSGVFLLIFLNSSISLIVRMMFDNPRL